MVYRRDLRYVCKERTNRRYAILIEKAAASYAEYLPDLPGCIVTGATVEETESLIREAIELILRTSKPTAFQFLHQATKWSTSTFPSKLNRGMKRSVR